MIKGIKFVIPGAQTGVVLFTMPGGLQPGHQLNLSFWSDDVEASFQEYESRGVEFIARPKKESWGTSAIFKDPDGNTFVLSSR